MAQTSKCIKCNSSSFELATKTAVKDSGHIIYFVQCALCGGVVSAFNAKENALIEKIAKKVGVMV